MLTYQSLKDTLGGSADEVAAKVCAIHGGMGLSDFKTHRGGLDISGCSPADKAKIEALIAVPKSEQEKTPKEGK